MTNARPSFISGNRSSIDRPVPQINVLVSLSNYFDYPAIILGAAQELVYANSEGETALCSGDVFQLRDGRAVVTDRKQELLWGKALRDSARGLCRLVFLGGPEHPVPVAVSPLSPSDEAQDQSLTLIVLGRPSPCSHASLQAYARSVGMTASEIRVIIGLLSGKTPEEIAASHRVSICTVRTQIRCLLEKSGSVTVRSLLLKLAALPPLRASLRQIRE